MRANALMGWCGWCQLERRGGFVSSQTALQQLPAHPRLGRAQRQRGTRFLPKMPESAHEFARNLVIGQGFRIPLNGDLCYVFGFEVAGDYVGVSSGLSEGVGKRANVVCRGAGAVAPLCYGGGSYGFNLAHTVCYSG